MTDQQFTTEELNSEDWKAIPGFEKYEASTLGRVRRIEPCQGRPAGYILAQHSSGRGYLMVCLQGAMGEKSVCVHKVIGQTFLPSPKDGQTQVNHKDGIKSNNRLTNLEWVTPKENTRHSIEVLGNDHSGENHAMVKLTAAQVIEIHNLRMQGYAANYIAGMYGVRKITVLRILHRRSWSKVLAGLPTSYPPAIHLGKRGQNNFKAKISNETAKGIKEALLTSTKRGDDKRIAERFGASLDTVRNIKYGRGWNHLD